MKRSVTTTLGALGLAVLLATPASAQVIQGAQFGFGAFLPKGLDARTDQDTLVENLSSIEPLAFMIDDFRNAHVFGEWLVAFGDNVEVAAGVGYYSRTVPSVYRDLIDADGSEIEQDLRLRIIPFTGIVRFLPFGRMSDVQPYVGAGIGAFNYRYSEIGEFVDTTDYSIFEGRFIANGTAIGSVFLGGVRIPLGGDIYGLTLEYRYENAVGDTGGIDEGFLNDKIDLGGGKFNFALLVRF